MKQKQRGMTLISFVLIAAVFSVLGFGLLKLAPIYLDNLKVRQLLKDIDEEWRGQAPSVGQVRTSIANRINIESISSVTARDFVISRSDQGLLVELSYESRTDYIGNIYLVVVFDDAVEIRR